MTTADLRSRLVAILAADAAGYSRLMAADDRATVAALDAARAVFRSRIESNRGRVIDMAGDSVLAVFETATEAVATALAVQDGLADLIADVPEDRRMRFRIGVHLGDVIEKADGTVYGDGVNIAARLQGLAEPGGITVSESIRAAVKGRVGASFTDQGEQTVKNIPDPVRAYRIGPASTVATTPKPAAGEIDLSLPDKPSIAVLPFTNMSGDPEQEYFTDGTTEDIITELSRFHSLFVIARNSSFTYKGKPVDVRTVAKELGVRYVLEGSIRKASNRIRVTAQLIDALTGNHLWAEKYDRVLEDIFALQEELTRDIVTTIAPEIEIAERLKLRRRPNSVSAYEMALRAWANAETAYHDTDTSLRVQAILEANEALAIDPVSTLALCALAQAQFEQTFHRTVTDIETAWRQGMTAALRAIELDPSDSRGHVVKALLYLFAPPTLGLPAPPVRVNEALHHLQRANELNPNDVSAMQFLSFCEALLGDPARAIERLHRCLRSNPRDPRSYVVFNFLSFAHFLAKDYASGVECGLRAARDAPELFHTRQYLAVNYVGAGDVVEAKAAMDAARRLSPEYMQARLGGYDPLAGIGPQNRHRMYVFLRIAAGLEDPSAADALR